MKYTISLILALSLFTAAFAQQAVNPAITPRPEVLKLKETSYDFGKIAQGKPVTHIFEVVNTGKEPIALENVQASCGCTTPEWSRQPILPGATQQITVGYNAATEGPFEKSITVFYNKGQMQSIQIKGTVWKTPDQSIPLNNSMTIFKN